ncbi:discoidin domain-containing protein [Parapedobacter sp. SGR-10]|uniref:discoidin domain-containing protein n=1 Tax=Parapedobacter sp. SGR-10 TaxID=2710879 RepID=UPI0013CFA73D|nr:discoidin domain-containing protein [Parapedobacter sp. SGR-10]NGF55172.1 discoidin domain-containing protein [Parapedobacter sp. SGR-10]
MKYRYLVAFWCVLFALGACKDEIPAVQENFISGVQNLKAISQMEGIVLSWENPDDRDYDKVEISYTLQGEKKMLTETINERYSAVSINIPNAEVYKFYIKAFSSVSGRFAREASVKGRKLVSLEAADELADILNSIEIHGGDNGVRVFWENTQNLPAMILLEYEGQVRTIDANSLSKEYSLGGLELNKQYTFTVSLVYEGEGSTLVRMLSATALEKAYRRLKNEGWTITASSEQSGQPAVNLLDNNPATYWRSSERVTVNNNPSGQHIIVDFKTIHRFSALTFTRRLGNDENSSWDINISFSEDGVTYTGPYMYKNASTDPNPIFKVEFNRTVDGEQMYQLPYTHTARYVRVDFVRGSNNGAYAVFGDINFYGE